MPKSFFLPDFDGISNVDQCADMEALDITMVKAGETLDIVLGMIAAIQCQKEIVEKLSFVYKIEYFRHPLYGEKDRCNHYVSVMAVPSDPTLRSFRVTGTYTQCWSWADAVSRAKELVWRCKEEKGIDVEFDMAVMA